MGEGGRQDAQSSFTRAEKKGGQRMNWRPISLLQMCAGGGGAETSGKKQNNIS